MCLGIRFLVFASAYRRYSYSLADIAAYLGCHYATVSRKLCAEEAAGVSQSATAEDWQRTRQ
jgi:hypothetical protein